MIGAEGWLKGNVLEIGMYRMNLPNTFSLYIPRAPWWNMAIESKSIATQTKKRLQIWEHYITLPRLATRDVLTKTVSADLLPLHLLTGDRELSA